MTPREEFEEHFGAIIDDEWQWLKEFLEKNLPAGMIDHNNIIGYRIDGRIYHPSDVELLLRTMPANVSNADKLERRRELNEQRRRWLNGEG